MSNEEFEEDFALATCAPEQGYAASDVYRSEDLVASTTRRRCEPPS